MQHEQPSVIFKDEDIRRVRLCAVHSLAGGRGNTFEARYPRRRSLDFDGDFGHIDAHERGVAEDLFPTCAHILPTREPVPIRMDTNGAGVRRPDFVHQVEIEAFQSEVELQVSFDHLFWIGHKV